MGPAEVTFDFDLKLKERSFIATILEKNSNTFNWIPKNTNVSFNQTEFQKAFIWNTGRGNGVISAHHSFL